MNHDKVFLGERFNIVYKVKNMRGDSFTIDNAQYDVEVDGQKFSGIGTIKDNEIKIFFSPDRVGIHTITLTYTIGAETRMARFIKEVVE